MSYTAIVLDRDSVIESYKVAVEKGLIPGDWNEKNHHCTLSMGAGDSRFEIGKRVVMVVTHYGYKTGRVSAFKIGMGAEMSNNKTPHITLAVAPDAKPMESNDIVNWIPITNFSLTGTIQICK